MFAISDYLSGGLTYAWTDSEIKKRISIDEAELMGWDGTLATLAQFGNVAGHKSPRVPEHMLSVFGRYERPMSNGNSWFIAADWAFEDSRFAQEHNLIETGERNIVGLQAGVNWGHWQFKVWVKTSWMTTRRSTCSVISIVVSAPCLLATRCSVRHRSRRSRNVPAPAPARVALP